LIFFGNEIKIGQRGIRYNGDYEGSYYIGFVVKEIDLFKKNPIGIKSDGKTKIGWVFPSHIIIQDSFKVVV